MKIEDVLEQRKTAAQPITFMRTVNGAIVVGSNRLSEAIIYLADVLLYSLNKNH